MFEDLTSSQWEEKLKVNGLALQWMKDPTENHCLLAVRQNGMALSSVPKTYRTLAICLAAMSQNDFVYRRELTQAERMRCLDYLKQHPERLKELGSRVLATLMVEDSTFVPLVGEMDVDFWVTAIERHPSLIWRLPDSVLTGQFMKSCFKHCSFTSAKMSNFAKRLTQLSQGRRFVLLKEMPQLYEHFRCYPFWGDFKEKAQLERLKMGIMDEFVLPLEEWTEEHYWSLILNLDLAEIQDLPSKFYEDAGVFQSNERRLAFGSLLVGFCMLPSETIDTKLNELLKKVAAYPKENRKFLHPVLKTWMSLPEGLQENGLLLGRLTLREKSYRCCRLAIQQTTEAKWFSPYHSLENLN